jgi:hypothetical protein
LHIPGRTTPEWTCQACLYPPCLGCGSARRKRTEMNRYHLPEYWCHPCIKKSLAESDQLVSSNKRSRRKKWPEWVRIDMRIVCLSDSIAERESPNEFIQ